MLEGNPFADLVPGNEGLAYKPPVPKQPTPASPPSALDLEKYGTSLSKEAFDQASKLRNDYTSDQRVKDFLAVTPGYVSALETAPNTSGDLSLIYAFAKMMDPISAVREGEQAAVAASDTLYGQTVARLKKELGEGGTFRPEVRQSLRSEMRRRYDNILTGYNQARDDYSKNAEMYGLPAQAIIGDPAGAPYADNIRDYAADLRGGPPPADPGSLPTTVDTGAPKPVLDEQGRPLMELTIDNPLGPEEATADEKRAEAYRQKQDRTFGKDDPRKLLLTHAMGGTLTDEASGIAAAFTNPLAPLESYRMGRDAERLRIEDARNQLGGWGTALEVGGGFLSFNPTAAMAPAANALAAFTQGAKGGAAGGAIYGYGSGEGFTDSLEKMAIGGTIGGTVGGALPVAGAAAGRMLQPRGRDPGLAADAAAEGVRLRSPMMDDNARRIKMGALESTSGGAPVIQRAVRETSDDIEAAAVRAGGPGNVATETAVPGEQIQNAGRRFIQRTKGVADRLYNRARSLAGPDAAVTPREGLAQLRRELQDLQQAENVNAGELAFINDIGADLTNGPLTVDAIRAIRQGVRGRINQQNLTASQADARAHRILDALHADIDASLPRAAATAFRRADTYYRERMIHIDDILDRFIGNTKAGQPRLSGEQAFKQLRTMASPGGDGRRLAALWRDMTADEQADVAATIMHTIGRRANQPDAPFSIDLFITQAATLSPAAKRTIFGPSGAESINRLVRLSRALQASQKEVNKTKSGSTVMRTIGGTLAAALMGGGGAGATMGAGTGAMVAGGTIAGMLAKTGINNLSARALMSPRVSAWLADVSQATTPAQVQRLANRLGVIASREPALAAELGPLQQILSGQVKPQPLPASEGEDQQ
jgi:hypothetical protein